MMATERPVGRTNNVQNKGIICDCARPLKRVASSVMKIGSGDLKYMKDAETAKDPGTMPVEKIEKRSCCSDSKAGQHPAHVSFILNFSDGTMRCTI